MILYVNDYPLEKSWTAFDKAVMPSANILESLNLGTG